MGANTEGPADPVEANAHRRTSPCFLSFTYVFIRFQNILARKRGLVQRRGHQLRASLVPTDGVSTSAPWRRPLCWEPPCPQKPADPGQSERDKGVASEGRARIPRVSDVSPALQGGGSLPPPPRPWGQNQAHPALGWAGLGGHGFVREMGGFADSMDSPLSFPLLCEFQASSVPEGGAVCKVKPGVEQPAVLPDPGYVVLPGR